MLAEGLVLPVIDRLKATVPMLNGRVHNAGHRAALMRSGQATQPQRMAHVVPSGLIGRAAALATEAFRQDLERGITVLLTVPSYDATGAGELDQLEDLVTAAVVAIAGWTPVSSPGVFQLSRGQLLSVQDGVMLYQLDFSLSDQLRIGT